ncbi:hypothetical protein ACDF64_13840 [Agromyces sp. MMS24-JH15]|uniref:hypothetical protein n=1 Tax=Agromyces sp. MMS24-JH15 TaxID=3243765 RepID=UPI003748A104
MPLPESSEGAILDADEQRMGTSTLRDAAGHAYGGVRITRQGADAYSVPRP